MSLHHLDPRTRGQQAPDVKTFAMGSPARWHVTSLTTKQPIRCCDYEGHPTEAAALTAARAAAGFAHVAEEPCATYQDVWMRDERTGVVIHECSLCAWPKFSHRTEEPTP